MLSALHPLPRLAVAIVWLIATIVVFDAGFLVAVILACVLALAVLERRPVVHVLLLLVPFALFGFGFLTTSLLFREQGAFVARVAGETPFGSSALAAGIVLFLRAVAGGMVSAVFVLTVDPGGLVKALMADLRLPPRIGYAVFSALHLVPDLAAEARQVRLARAMKAGRAASRFPGPIETVSLVIPLIAFAIRRAGRAAIALEARGLSAGRARTVTGAPRLRPRDGVFAVLSLGLLAGLVLAV